MKIKKLAAFIFSIFVVLCFTGCLNPFNSFSRTKNKSKSNYTFNISNFPSDTVGMTVRARSNKDYDYVDEDIGIIEDVTQTLSKTVSLYSNADSLEIQIYKGDSVKYEVKVTSSHKNPQTGAYDISGYYYYYARHNGDLNAAIDITKIQTLEYGKNYYFNNNSVPYLIWKATDVKDKNIKCIKSGDENIMLFIFSDLQAFIDGDRNHVRSNIYNSTTDEIYIVICPYNPSSASSCLISFSLTDDDAEAQLDIKGSVLASNGKLYAFGNNYLSDSLCNLWEVNADENAMNKVKAFGDEITCIAELVQGTLFIAHNKTISKLNLATNEITDLKILDKKVLAIENYKNDYIIAVCPSDRFNDNVRLIKKTTGDVETISGEDISREMEHIDSLLYIPEIDLFVFDRKGVYPNNIHYLVIDDIDPENLSYLSKEAFIMGASGKLGGPYLVYDTNSSQGTARVIASGDVYEVDRNEALSQTSVWCKEVSGVSCVQHKACYMTGENIYYASVDGFDLLVKKCSKTSTTTVLNSKEYRNENPIKFFYYNSQLYLLTNSTVSSNGSNNYQIYLHKIDF